MILQNQIADLDRSFSDVDAGKPAGHGGIILRAFLLSLALFTVAALLVYWVVNDRERQVIGELAQRNEILASTKAEVLQSWLSIQGTVGERLSRSDVFRLFAAEAGLNGDTIMSDQSLAAQLPYMIQVVTEFARQEGLLGVHLVDGNGRAILASGGAADLIPAQRQAAKAVFLSKKRAVTALRQYPEGLALDVLLPVAPPQEPNPTNPEHVSGVFILAIPVHTALAKMLKPSPLVREEEATRLFQVESDGLLEILPAGRPVLKKASITPTVAAGQVLSFDHRNAVGEPRPVYSFGTWVPGMSWLVMQETETKSALKPLRSFTWGAVTIATFLTLSVVTGFIAFWWNQASTHNEALALQYRTLGAQIAAQRHFLKSVMSTVTEMIGLKRKDGTYIYVNPSFAGAVDRSPENIEGLDDIEVFGRGTAERLRHSDESALVSQKRVMVDEVVHLADGAHHLQMSKVPYREQNGDISGILIVARDVTEIHEAEQRRKRGIQAMTDAFLRTIEQIDPYLSGHSQNVRDIGVGIAQHLNLSQDEISTINIAAMLAQIGKLSVPKEIVAKAARLNPEELKLMQGHIGHAVSILRDVEFGLPVMPAIEQMYERLDGSGYPAKLAGDQISLLARVLAVADVFSARLEQRSYRAVISPEEAIKVLMDNAIRYDQTVVAALANFFASIDGEKVVARIQGN